MRLSVHFTLAELTASGTAERLGILNAPTPDILLSLRRLCHELEKVRTAFGQQPLKIASGYRCPDVNKAVGGTAGSYHQAGLAADFDPPLGLSFEEAKQRLADAADFIAFDLVLDEGTADKQHRWLHFQIARDGKKPRHLIKTAEVDRLGGRITRVSVG